MSSDIFLKAALAGLMPDKVQTVSSWADENRVLSSKDSSEPGKFRTDRTPYIREINDCLSNDSPVEEVVFMAGAQIGKTSAMLSWLGYVINVSPGPMLMVQPTVDLAKRFSRQRVSPMIEETEVLRNSISSLKRDSENTILMKAFQGGTLMLAGANSAAGLRSMPIRYLALDEIDAYPPDVEGEGSPVELAKKRTTTFNRKKIFMTSTPTVKDASMIEAEYLKGDQRKYYVPCPHCDHKQHLEWKQLKWSEGDPTTAAYACSGCGTLIEERYKTQMLLAGEWRAHAKCSDKVRSYHLNSLYSPLGWKSWASIVEDFIKAKDDPPALKTWVNTTLGETWEDNYSATLDPQNLMGRAEDYDRLSVPDRALFCTMGVDVQDDRLEATLYGWAEGEETWKVDHTVIYGDPSMPEVWKQLTEVRRSEIRRADGQYLTLECCAIDSGGHHTQQVYQYAKEHKQEWVIAVKGSSIPGKPVIGKPSKVDFKLNGNMQKNGAELYIVGVNSAKTIIYSRLRKAEQGPGYYHFPKTATHDFFQQLTAEKQIVKYHNGMPSKIWVKKDGARNEALDTTVYAYAALNHIYLRLNRHTLWQQFRELITNRQVDTTGVSTAPAALIQQDTIVRKKSSFWG